MNHQMLLRLVAAGVLGGGAITSFSDNFNRADGAVGNGWIGSSWAVSGNKVINTPTLGAEMFANPGAEGTYVAGLAPNWQDTVGTGTHAESATAHGGTKAQRVSATAGQRSYVCPVDVPTVAGSWYLLSIWGNLQSGFASIRSRSGLAKFQTETTDIVGGGWRKHTIFGKGTGGGTAIAADCYGQGDIMLDDASCKSLSYSSLFLLRDTGMVDVACRASLAIPASVGITLSGIVVSADSLTNPANYVVAFFAGDRLILAKILNNVETILINTSPTYYRDGELLEIRKSGTTYQLFYAGEQVSTDQTIADATIVNNRYCGLIDISGMVKFENFSVRKFGTLPHSTLGTPTYSGATYPANTGVLSLFYADWPATDYTLVYPLLAARGLVGGFSVPRVNIGSGTNPTLTQLLEMQAAGNEIHCHGRGGPNPTDYATFADETALAVEEMRALGINVDTFAQPGQWVAPYYFNSVDQYGTPEESLLRQYFAAYRAFVVSSNLTLPAPVSARYGIAHQTIDAMTLIQAEAIVDAITAGHGQSIGCHSYLIGTAGYISVADFTAFLDYVAAKVTAGTLTMLTPTQQLFAQPV